MDVARKVALWLIKRFEGCRLVAYLCPARVWTIGWGATGPDVKQGVVWSQEQADARLEHDLGVYLSGSARLCPLVSDERLGAIADFAYNLGLTRLSGSTLRRLINAGQYDDAAEEIKKWVWAGGRKLPGLILRRSAESEIIRKGTA